MTHTHINIEFNHRLLASMYPSSHGPLAWQPLFTSAWGNKPPPTPRTFSYPGLGIEHQWATFHSWEITRVTVGVMLLWVFDGSITCSFSTGHHGAVKFYCFASVFHTGWKQHVEKAQISWVQGFSLMLHLQFAQFGSCLCSNSASLEVAQGPLLDLLTLINVTVVWRRFIQVHSEISQGTASVHSMGQVLHDWPLPSTVLQKWCIHRLEPQLLQRCREAGIALDTLQSTPINGQIQFLKACRQLTQHGTKTFLGLLIVSILFDKPIITTHFGCVLFDIPGTIGHQMAFFQGALVYGLQHSHSHSIQKSSCWQVSIGQWQSNHWRCNNGRLGG